MIAAIFRQRMKLSGLRSFDSIACRLACLFGIIGVFLIGCGTEESKTSADRVPWDYSRLEGSPELPAPYVSVNAYPEFTVERLVAIELEPGSGALLLLQNYLWSEKRSTLRRYDPQPKSGNSDLLLELDEPAYSLAFHPKYETNGFLYVGSNGPGNDGKNHSRITRYTVDRNAPYRLKKSSAFPVIEWPSNGHNGAAVCFGNDGMLYVTSGDGTSLMDLDNMGQNLMSLKSKVLRLDVDAASSSQGYVVPQDNPFVGSPGIRPETWAYGTRNPWRISNDSVSGQIWIGENGQDLMEFVQLVRRGANYGWSAYEGSRPLFVERLSGPSPVSPPTIEHDHSVFRSLTGGFVYRGQRFSELVGAYIYGDYSTGRIWAAKHDGVNLLWNREIADTTLAITAFGTNLEGDILVADHAGNAIWKLVPNLEEVDQVLSFPTKLSETGLYASTIDLKPAPGVIPYEIVASAWHDGAVSKRLLALPGTSKAKYPKEESRRSDWLSLRLPDGAAVAQTLVEPHTTKRVETRVIVKQHNDWAAYSYLWNEDQSDATLVPKEGLQVEVDGLNWEIPSRSTCLVCHSRQADFVLSLTPAQLNRDVIIDGEKINQIELLARQGVLEVSSIGKEEEGTGKLVDPHDKSASVSDRMHAYFTTNCSHCHMPNGGGNATMDLSPWASLENQHLIDATPEHGDFGVAGAKLIARGNPGRSIVPLRVALRGTGQMPPVGTLYPDVEGVRLLLEWHQSID